MERTILVVDDDVLVGRSMKRLITGFNVVSASCASDALALAELHEPAAAIVDYQLNEIRHNGLDVVKRLRGMSTTMSIAIMTAFPSMKLGFQAAGFGCDRVFDKPLVPDELVEWLKGARSTTSQQTLLAMKNSHIIHVLAQTQGNKSEAARRLGIRRTSLQRILRQLAERE